MTKRLLTALPAAAALTLALAGAAGAEVCQDCGGGGGGGGTVNKKPVASFTIDPATTYRNTAIALNGSGSSDQDGSIAGYDWEWTGDTTPDATAATTSVSYPTLGTKTITLRVKDNKGAWSDPVSKTVSIVNRAPSGQVDCGEWLEKGQTTTCKPWQASDADGSITAYDWDLDDDGQYDDGSGTAVEWTPTEVKTHKPKLRMTDNEGAVTPVIGTTTVWQPHVSNVAFSVSDAVAGKPVTFSSPIASGEAEGMWSYTREWRFGAAEGTRGATTDSGRTTTFTFAKPGTYEVKFRQINDERSWDPRNWSERTQTVVVKAAPVAGGGGGNPQGGGGQQQGGQQPQGGGQQQQQGPAPQASPVAQAVTTAPPALRSSVATTTAKSKAATKKKSAKKCSTKKRKASKKAKASAKKKRASTCATPKKKRSKKATRR